MNLEGYSLGCPPAQDASQHQDLPIFLVGDLYKPPVEKTASWEGGTPKVIDLGN